MFSFLRAKQQTKASHVIPRGNFDATVGGAMAALQELPRISEHAKARLRKSDPITQTDLEELLRMLAEAKRRIDTTMQTDLAKWTETGETEWDQNSYEILVVPTINMANSPQAIIDLTLAAADSGAKTPKLLYELMVAEIDVAVARYYVTMNTGLLTA